MNARAAARQLRCDMQNPPMTLGRPSAFVLAIAGLLAVAGCSAAAPAPTNTAATVPATAAPTVAVTTPPTLPAPTLRIVAAMVGAPDSGLTVDLIGYKFAWNVKTMSAPAGKSWHVNFDMQDKTCCGGAVAKHNLVIETGTAFSQRIFSSDTVPFGTYALDIPGLPAGTYTFLCTVHPESMNGVLTIG